VRCCWAKCSACIGCTVMCTVITRCKGLGHTAALFLWGGYKTPCQCTRAAVYCFYLSTGSCLPVLGSGRYDTHRQSTRCSMTAVTPQLLTAASCHCLKAAQCWPSMRWPAPAASYKLLLLGTPAQSMRPDICEAAVTGGSIYPRPCVYRPPQNNKWWPCPYTGLALSGFALYCNCRCQGERRFCRRALLASRWRVASCQ
jgi:hypothetical protein